MNLQGLLSKAKEFHGHVCPFLALGIRASAIALKHLKATKAGESESIEEELLAIVECNNCFADGVQIATGCTFGNNSLIYLDLGKNAVTLVRRGEWTGVRVYVDAENVSKYFPEEANQLFEKVVVRREGSDEDRRRLSRMWEEIGIKMLELHEGEFKVETVDVEKIEQAPIFRSVRCKKCGELVMASRLRDSMCYSCAKIEVHAVLGEGIVHIRDLRR